MLTRRELKYRMNHMRFSLREKQFGDLLTKPSNIFLLIYFIFRSLMLRMVPRCTSMYFIRKEIKDNPVDIMPTGYIYKLIDHYSNEISDYAKKRCSESDNLFIEIYSEQIKERFKSGTWACTLLTEGEISCIFFISTKSQYIEQVDYSFAPKANEIAITDIYTPIKYRQKGMYQILLKQVFGYYQKSGFDSGVMWIMKHNAPTIKSQLKAGFTDIFQTVTYFSWLGFGKTFVRQTIKPLNKL